MCSTFLYCRAHTCHPAISCRVQRTQRTRSSSHGVCRVGYKKHGRAGFPSISVFSMSIFQHVDIQHVDISACRYFSMSIFTMSILQHLDIQHVGTSPFRYSPCRYFSMSIFSMSILQHVDTSACRYHGPRRVEFPGDIIYVRITKPTPSGER